MPCPHLSGVLSCNLSFPFPGPFGGTLLAVSVVGWREEEMAPHGTPKSHTVSCYSAASHCPQPSCPGQSRTELGPAPLSVSLSTLQSDRQPRNTARTLSCAASTPADTLAIKPDDVHVLSLFGCSAFLLSPWSFPRAYLISLLLPLYSQALSTLGPLHM